MPVSPAHQTDNVRLTPSVEVEASLLQIALNEIRPRRVGAGRLSCRVCRDLVRRQKGESLWATLPAGKPECGLPPLSSGVTFILDTKLQAARTALRSGRSVHSTAGPHRSLRARARSCTMCSPVAPFHLAPQRFIRTSNRLLQVASALPLPSGRPSRRARA